MAFSDDNSKTGSWSSKLYSILRPVPHAPLTPALANSYSRLRHSPGDIWKQTFSTSIYYDLAGPALKHDSLHPVIWRRFVRVEHIGLSGVVIYEIPIPPSTASTEQGYISTTSSQCFTLEGVFGDLSEPDALGMDLDDLLDTVGAKMVYFPAYACTSFIVGQVMSAYFKDQPTNRPFPAYQGFSIRLGEKDQKVKKYRTVEDTACSMRLTGDTDAELTALSHETTLDSHLMIALSLEADSPYASLCIRTSTLHKLHSLDHSAIKDDIDHLASTVASSGPLSQHIATKSSGTFAKSSQALYTYDSLLSFLDFAEGGTNVSTAI